MFFTNTGRVYVERVHEIPDMGRAAKGRSIANLLELKRRRKNRRHDPDSSKKSGTGPSADDQTWDENLHIVFATQPASSRNRTSPISRTSAKAASSPSRSRKATG